MTRIDLFTTVHKCVRLLLFDVATAAARIELASDREVDVLDDRIEHALDLVEDHERAEHIAIMPAIASVDRELALRVELVHHELDASSTAVRRAARALAIAASGERSVPSRELLQAVNDLTVRCLAHLHAEETLVSAVLWGALGDRELLELRRQTMAHLVANGCAPWLALLERGVSDAERAVLFKSCIEPR